MTRVTPVPLSPNEHFPQALVMSLSDFFPSYTQNKTMQIGVRKKSFLKVNDLSVHAFRKPSRETSFESPNNGPLKRIGAFFFFTEKTERTITRYILTSSMGKQCSSNFSKPHFPMFLEGLTFTYKL